MGQELSGVKNSVESDVAEVRASAQALEAHVGQGLMDRVLALENDLRAMRESARILDVQVRNKLSDAAGAVTAETVALKDELVRMESRHVDMAASVASSAQKNANALAAAERAVSAAEASAAGLVSLRAKLEDEQVTNSHREVANCISQEVIEDVLEQHVAEIIALRSQVTSLLQ